MRAASFREGARPLLLLLAWFVILSVAAFAWAAVESQSESAENAAAPQAAAHPN